MNRTPLLTFFVLCSLLNVMCPIVEGHDWTSACVTEYEISVVWRCGKKLSKLLLLSRKILMSFSLTLHSFHFLFLPLSFFLSIFSLSNL